MASFCCRLLKYFETVGYRFLADASCGPQNIYSAKHKLRSCVLCHLLSSTFCREEAEKICSMLLRMPAGQSSSKGAIQLTDKPAVEFANVRAIFFVYFPRSSSTFLTWDASRRMLNTVRNGRNTPVLLSHSPKNCNELHHSSSSIQWESRR